MTHTPGPWIVDGKPGYEAPEIHAGNRRIARVLYHLGSEDREVDANARLMAAAPDLLEACKLTIDDIGEHGGPNSVYKACTAAIAKAEGE